VGYVAHMKEMINAFEILVAKHEEDGTMLLKWILKQQVVSV
jgi:hypothetical protein